MKTLAIIGQPNVGKSSLFNRLCGAREAIVADSPGVTRDRHFGHADWFGSSFFVVDTGGFVPLVKRGRKEVNASKGNLGIDSIQDLINEQVGFALNEADIILFLVDVQSGITALELEIARIIRQSGKPVFLAVNKVDNQKLVPQAQEFYTLGFPEIYPISVTHGSGLADLMEIIANQYGGKDLFESQEDLKNNETMRICFLGKPNVGKSSLLNALLGEKRSVVHHEPGTTRDSVLAPIEFQGEKLFLVDTAGIRKWAKRKDALEHYSVIRSFSSLRLTDIALFTLDATNPFTQQDQVIASKIQEHGCGILILLNKWDLITGGPEKYKEIQRDINKHYHFLDNAPLLTVSALDGLRMEKILQEALAIKKSGDFRVPQEELDELLRDALILNPPPATHMKHARILKLEKKFCRGAQFALKVTQKKAIHFSYQRYLKNLIKERFAVKGWPVHLAIHTPPKKGETDS